MILIQDTNQRAEAHNYNLQGVPQKMWLFWGILQHFMKEQLLKGVLPGVSADDQEALQLEVDTTV